ncbi:MAG: 30S ribosomal protein S20 [Bacteroidales bacterium]|nr:30S ribosomal protein S20 [Bacteroidales bacterium]
MANHKSAIRRIRANDKKRDANRYYAKTMRNALKKARAITVKEEAITAYSPLASLIDKLAKKRIIHKNKAANLKSGLMHQINKL